MQTLSRLSVPQLKTVNLFGAACGHGANDSRTRQGPAALRRGGLVPWLESNGIEACWRDTLAPPDSGAGMDGLTAVAGICQRLSCRVRQSVEEGGWFAVLGGDHSIAVGTWSGAYSALGSQGPLGLIWVDAHMDAHVPESSPSGKLHGMPLACLLGFGPEALTALAPVGPAVRPEHVALIGVRSYEDDEERLLRHLGVRVFTMEEVLKRGVGPVFEEALRIASDGTAGFGLTVDLDALDPIDAPAVGSPVTGGFRRPELAEGVRLIARQPGFLGIEIAEYNPSRDRKGVTAHTVREILAAGIPEIYLP